MLAYVLLTAFRDFRDNFAAEIWTALGHGGEAAIFSASELPVAVIALVGMGAVIAVRDNRRALMTIHAMVGAGFVLLGLSTAAFQAHLIPPLTWMILAGSGSISLIIRSTRPCSTGWRRSAGGRPTPAS